VVTEGGHSCTQPVTLTRGPVKTRARKCSGVTIPAGIRTQGRDQNENLVVLDHGLPPFRAVPEQCSCGVRSPIPLRDSPGFTPGSLL